MAEHWAWISGWGVRPERFQSIAEACFPAFAHAVFPPGPSALDAVLASGHDRIGGYSLGSLLVLQGLEKIPGETGVFCFAPILGFCKEAGLGGTTPAAGLARIRERLGGRPEAALKLFYRLAGLVGEAALPLPYAAEDLDWGLARLADLQVEPGRCRRVTAVIGENDPLLDSRVLREFFDRPVCVPTGHDYNDLLRAPLPA